MNVFYFGCIDRAGHFLWAPDGSRPRPFGHRDSLGERHLDGGFCPGAEAPFYRDPLNVPQGAAALHLVGAWTVLSFWDRSVDGRPGSHSTYVLLGALTFNDAVARAKTAFPNVWKRYGFAVTPWTPSGATPPPRREESRMPTTNMPTMNTGIRETMEAIVSLAHDEVAGRTSPAQSQLQVAAMATVHGPAAVRPLDALYEAALAVCRVAR